MKLSQEEHQKLLQLTQQKQEIELRIGKLEFAKFEAVKSLDENKASLKTQELKLIEKYGRDVSINLETGQIKNNDKD